MHVGYQGCSDWLTRKSINRVCRRNVLLLITNFSNLPHSGLGKPSSTSNNLLFCEFVVKSQHWPVFARVVVFAITQTLPFVRSMDFSSAMHVRDFGRQKNLPRSLRSWLRLKRGCMWTTT